MSLFVVTVLLTACDSNGDDGLAAVTRATVAGSSVASRHPVLPVGFERAAGTITAADGTVCEVCLWLAETGDQRSRGLMGVTDVGTSNGTADGMAFVYPRPHTGTFWMKNTLLPLSIAFFDQSGAFLSSFDMEPCTADPCPSYPTAPEFTAAIEVPQGGLPSLAIAEGSILDLTNLPCTES